MVKARLKVSARARRFLESGQIASADPYDIVRELDNAIREEAQHDLTAALKLAEELLDRAVPFPGQVRSIAYRTLGWVHVLAANYPEAEAAYLRARDLVAGDPQARARIDRILIDIYMYLGRMDEARRRARNSIRTFQRLKDPDGAMKTRVNLANVYHRQDRHVEALRLYEKAVAHYAKSDEKVTLAVCCYNCANCLVQLLRFDEANDLYIRAENLFEQIGHDLYANEARYGRAWLDKLRGDYHLSLRALAECERSYREAGQLKGVTLCQLDRAEVMLELQLLADARSLAREAEKNARKLKIEYESSKAALFCAKAAYGLGSRAEAQRALKRAAAGFRLVENRAMLAVTSFYEALYLQGSKAIEKLDTAGSIFHSAQLPLWQALCDLTSVAVTAPHYDQSTMRRLRANLAVGAVPHLHAGWKTLLGDRAMHRNDMKSALKNWTEAADTLDTMRAKLPPVDLRQSLTAHHLDPHQRMFAGELPYHPEAAAIWAERSKTSGIWAQIRSANLPETRKRIRDHLAQLAQQVSAVSGALENTRGEAVGQPLQAGRSFQRLLSDIRQQFLALGEEVPSAHEIQARIGNRLRHYSREHPLVQFHEEGDRLIAFIHFDGHTRVHIYHQADRALSKFLGQWNLLLGETLRQTSRIRRTELAEEVRLLQQLGDWLWAPLEIASSDSQLTIIPVGKTTALPWWAIRHDGQALIDRHSFLMSPSISHLDAAGRRRAGGSGATVFVGDTTGLRFTKRELETITELMGPQSRVINPAGRSDWPESGDAAIWHYVGHAEFRGDNPFYSSLTLEDGPLFAADLRLRRCNVGLVTLAACRTGVQSSVPSYEPTGLVRSFLEMGAHNVVASHWSVSDRATADWMAAFYSQLKQQYSLIDSVKRASVEMRSRYRSAAQWAAFSLFGSGKNDSYLTKKKESGRP